MVTSTASRLVCLTVTLLVCCGVQHAAASRAESILTAHNSNRKLLACMAMQDPMYKEGGQVLPLCATQYFPDNGVGEGQFRRVTPDSAEPMSKANAADLAHAWFRDPVNPKTDSTLQCSGELDITPKKCWSGKAVEIDATFSSISCCSTSISCYIKSGGCVMR